MKTHTYTLYALKLEDSCWYIGITKDVQSRFSEHTSGKRGAAWTRAHRPLEVYETRETTTVTMKGASQYENMMTLEYALRYGEDKVRGGRYSNIKYPNFPK